MVIEKSIYDTWGLPKQKAWWVYLKDEVNYVVDGITYTYLSYQGLPDDAERELWWDTFKEDTDSSAKATRDFETWYRGRDSGCEADESWPGFKLRDNFIVEKDKKEENELERVQRECCEKEEYFRKECEKLNEDINAALKKTGCPALEVVKGSVAAALKKSGCPATTNPCGCKKM